MAPRVHAAAHQPTQVVLRLPAWARRVPPPPVLATAEARMRWVLTLAERNVAAGSGGPFAAAVFDSSNGRLVAFGVNSVVATSCSVAHAEVMAIALAQARLQVYDLGGVTQPDHELITSAEPCCQCFGAILWSGVRRLVCGARGADVAAIGFDEGPKPRGWVAELRRRGIEVQRDVLRTDARAVLQAYAAAGGPIYAPRCG